jgi:hypothetical protein
VSALSASALFTPYPELERAARIQNQLLESLSQRIASTEGYEYIDIDLMHRVPIDALAVDDVWMIGPWGLEAWLEIVHANHRYRVSETARSGIAPEEYRSITLSPIYAWMR